MTHEEKSQKRAAEIAGVREGSFFLRAHCCNGARSCSEHESIRSNIALAKDIIEDDAQDCEHQRGHCTCRGSDGSL